MTIIRASPRLAMNRKGASYDGGVELSRMDGPSPPSLKHLNFTFHSPGFVPLV